MRRSREAGVTLVELMLAVAIAAILAAIAYPNYRQYVLRANRTEGQALLLDAAVRQERYFAQNNSYIVATAELARLGLPRVTVKGAESTGGKYLLTVERGAEEGGYWLTVTPQGTQAQDLRCGALSLNAQGEQHSAAGDAAECWR
ncbi:prepilin-type N-terminal cleavage/methylation domain-containing protein [Pseudomonas sp. LA21]|uniref:type IV pilin protein n=1 Tax=unclassified Pseudomonas TaxID=196821 RepID=UPI001FB69C7E|nr:type IV pilin protein [Pseudomonas sp. LA21]MCJ1883669.1 prepilin-type N-terminal cleavage/methylation domain-containing protein [Pseudomonas sp. LA21]